MGRWECSSDAWTWGLEWWRRQSREVIWGQVSRGLKAKLRSLDWIPGIMGRGEWGLEQGRAVRSDLLLSEDDSSPSVTSAQESRGRSKGPI